jgi:methylase of polypeptide subunit release factors
MPETTAAFDAALKALLQHLREQAYTFTTVTPLTHARVLVNRQGIPANNLRDIFGWSLGFSDTAMPAALLDLLVLHGVVVREEAQHRSRVRVASFDGDLFVHSAFPTLANDAVFFGPDTYRFLNLIRDHMPVAAADKPLRIADVGCGSGAGGIMAARLRVGAQVTLNDINPLALRYAGINAASAGVDVELALSDALSAVAGDFDVVLSNPPYLEDDAARAYRHGGGDLGRALSVKIGAQALQRLLPGGRLILYTGVAMVDGVDHFIREMEPFLGQAACTYTYAEIDPDVFGEELERPVYRQADRIAAVGLVAVKA